MQLLHTLLLSGDGRCFDEGGSSTTIDPSSSSSSSSSLSMEAMGTLLSVVLETVAIDAVCCELTSEEEVEVEEEDVAVSLVGLGGLGVGLN